MYSTVDIRAFQTTVLVTCILFVKLLITLIIQASKRTKSGTCPPEDNLLPWGKDEHGLRYVLPVTVADNQKAIAEDARWQMAIREDVRWQRIVANDLESLLFGVIIAVLTVFVARSSIAHIVLYVVFAFCRVLHTLFYGLGIQPFRSIVWYLGVLCIIGLGVNGLVGVFIWDPRYDPAPIGM